MDDRGRGGDGTVHVRLDDDQPEPWLAVAETTAELKGVDATDLSPIYRCVDHLLERVFSTPPDPEANVEIGFDYEGYRVTVRQDGFVTFDPRDG